MKKRFLSLFLALALCLGLCAVPAFAANQKIYFKLTKSTETEKFSISVVEANDLSDRGDLNGLQTICPVSISGTDLKQAGTVVYTGTSEYPTMGMNGMQLVEFGYQITVPVYTASAPVTVTVEIGAERGVDEDGTPTVYAQVDLASYDAANKTGKVLKEHTLFLDGYYSFMNHSGKIEDISIEEYYTTDNVQDRILGDFGICRGAAATLSAPGTYRIKSGYMGQNVYFGLEHTYDVFVIITDGASSDPAPTPSFTDVPAGAFYTDAVNWAVKQDITNGTGDGTTFSPGRDCTHEQILTFLYRAARGEGAAVAEDTNKAISWAREKGMIGADFNRSAKCTRADAVSYIWQAFGKKGASASSFNDVSAGAGYAAAVNWAVENGIVNGYANNDGSFSFKPDTICNRGVIVTLLYRAYVEEARLNAK